MTQVKAINVHEATIKTATVEVKTLTISGRQVTLSVFRQLPVEPVILFDPVRLAGKPWGRVHYFPAPCDKAADGHLHVVWQRGGELLRACVDPPHLGYRHSYSRWSQWRHDTAADIRRIKEDAAKVSGLSFAAEMLEDITAASVTTDNGYYTVRLPSGRCWGKVDTYSRNYGEAAIKIVSMAATCRVQNKDGYNPVKIEDAKKLLAHLLQSEDCVQWSNYDGITSWENTASGLDERADEMTELARSTEAALAVAVKAYPVVYQEMVALPQLFIAT